MKLVFDVSTECEALVSVINIDKKGLQQLNQLGLPMQPAEQN